METKRNWGGKRGGLFLRSNVRRVKSSLRAYKVSRCYRGVSNWEEEGEEKRRKEERRLGGRKKDRGNKLWKRERGYIYIYIYTGGVPWSIDPVSNQRFSIQISVGGTPI